MSDDIGAVTERTHAKIDANIDKLIASVPAFAAVLESHEDAPEVTLRCPRGHRLVLARLQRDHNFRPFLEPAARPHGRIADGWDELLHRSSAPDSNALVTERVRLSCRQCRYDGTYHQDDLLGLYAIALHRSKKDIVLPR